MAIKTEEKSTVLKWKDATRIKQFVRYAKVFGLGILVGVLLTILLTNSTFSFKRGTTNLKSGEAPSTVETHDLILNKNGFGYTAADFANAVIDASKQEKSLIVYRVKMSDVVKLTESGLANWKVFEKYQYITYHGTAIYTVDLTKMKARDIYLDETNKTVTIYIPHAKLDSINTPASEMEIQDVEKGLLAFGDLQLSAENYAKVETTAKEKMKEKLDADKAIDEADRFAKLSTWEIYQPLISKIAPQVKINIEFQ